MIIALKALLLAAGLFHVALAAVSWRRRRAAVRPGNRAEHGFELALSAFSAIVLLGFGLWF